MKSRNIFISLVLLGSFFLSSIPVANAHHSFARFDQTKTVVLKGKVRTVEWQNPHIWLWLWVDEVNGEPVADENGEPVVWGLEGIAPGELLRSGSNWKRNTLQQGDDVIVTGSPLKDGRPGGGLGSITLGDGTVIHGNPPAAQ